MPDHSFCHTFGQLLWGGLGNQMAVSDHAALELEGEMRCALMMWCSADVMKEGGENVGFVGK